MKVSWFKLFFWISWVVFIFLLTSMLSDPQQQQKITSFLSNIAQKPYFIPLFFAFLISIFLIFYLPFWWSSFRQTQLSHRLKEEGVLMLAQIKKVEDTGITVNKNPKVKITVAVSDQTASFELTVSRVNIPQVGDFMTVIYDPKDHTKAVPANY
ncbi:MAG: hypothetical protein RLZ47_210 [Bacteroidota bacterium]|jgi:hypothetical protein